MDQNKTNTNSVKKVHPWAMHGDLTSSEPIGIIALPDSISLHKAESESKKSPTPEESERERTEMIKSAIMDVVSIASVIDQPPLFLEVDSSNKVNPTPDLSLIKDCSALNDIFEQMDSIYFLTQQSNNSATTRAQTPDQEILKSMATWPLLFPSPPENPKRNQEKVTVESKISPASTTESDSEPDREKRDVGNQAFTQILSREKEPSKVSTESDMKKSNFLQWLTSQKNKEKPIKEKSKNEPSLEGARLKEEKKQAKKDKKAKKKARKKAKKKKKKAKKKAKKEKLEQLLRSSNEIGDEILSETLAKLLAHQGHADRAIDMYKKLSLLNPKKSSYFAEIIEKLEEK